MPMLDVHKRMQSAQNARYARIWPLMQGAKFFVGDIALTQHTQFVSPVLAWMGQNGAKLSRFKLVASNNL